MIENTLSEMLKKYVEIFINEYQAYLPSDTIESLQKINYQNIFSFDDITSPFGEVVYGKIHLSKVSNELINTLQQMDNYNSCRYNLNNKNISSYLKYMCDNGYSLLEYLGDILMYFVFFMAIKNNSGFTNGLINQEVKYLGIKYSLRSANLYAKEETIVGKITPIFKLDTLRKILFMDKVTRFKFLSEQYGFRYAKLVEDIEKMIDDKYSSLNKRTYQDFKELLDYAENYDNLTFGEVYNHLLDFEVENRLK